MTDGGGGMYRARGINTAEEMSAAYRLRADAYVHELGFLPATALVGGYEVDEHDADARHGGLFHADDGLVGTVRLIPGHEPLPVETMFSVSVTDPAVEVSRLVVAPRHRSGEALLPLLSWAVQQFHAMEVREIYAVVEESLFSALRGIGFPFRQLAEPQVVYNTTNFPIGCRVDELASGVSEADRNRKAQLGSLFLAPSTPAQATA